MIEAPARDALALRLVLRDPAADESAGAFIGGLGWPAGTMLRVVDRRSASRNQISGDREALTSRLARPGIRILDQTRTNDGEPRRRRPDDLVITGGACRAA